VNTPQYCAGGDMPFQCSRPLLDAEGNPELDGDGNPLVESFPPESCQRVRDCGANLTTEGGPSGRRKLVVSLPDEGSLIVIDAQSILDREQGSFQPCEIEATFPLSSAPDPSGQAQPDPEELHPEGCELALPPAPPNPPSFVSRPAGMAVLDGSLYVGDQGVPVVHVLDATSPCGLSELPPLLPMAFDDPNREVTTSRVAVSPLTPSGKRFVYAIDENDRPAASLMAFDVSPGSTDRTPVMRPGSLRTPDQPPDRIRFTAPIADVTFGLRDLPREDPGTGVSPAGIACDPDVNVDASDPSLVYRPNGDYTGGARPDLLRGLFAFAMLTTGDLAIIDVDDFDAECRRSRHTNSEDSPDFRGCVGDTYATNEEGELRDGYGRSTVTDEVSCNMVSPHRARAAIPGAPSETGAPVLRAFPQFTNPDRSSQQTSADLPKLLAVPFEAPGKEEGTAPEVYVSTTLYRGGGGEGAVVLATDPNGSDQSTLALPLQEPRNYAPSDTSEVTYEGVIAGVFQNGFFDFSKGETTEVGPYQVSKGELRDTSAAFCDHGVYDEDMMADYGTSELDVSEDELVSFQRAHADYIQITGDFPDAYDPYWVQHGDRSCGGRKECLSVFGPATAQDLDPRRDFRVIEAYQDRVVIAPHLREDRLLLLSDSNATETEPSDRQKAINAINEAASMVDCCFPGGTQYRVRASNQWVMLTSAGRFRHDVTARAPDLDDDGMPDPPVDEDGDGVIDGKGSYRCERDCNPRKRFNRSRAFEITSTRVCSIENDAERCGVGVKDAWLSPCAYDPLDGGSRGVQLTDDAAACIVENLTSRFAVYRGLAPSVRDMKFRWETTGGFYPLTVSLRGHSSLVLPQRVEYVPEVEWIFLTDAAQLGLSAAPLDTLRVEDPWPVF
jgi:hypothetical protein